mmetsp:Transcript_3856/g.7669  ORF Transcript_3856/g.7669 Transcript_3856/m.7669 type:complete len:203 (-) Transcript_3856:586-1194(-)
MQTLRKQQKQQTRQMIMWSPRLSKIIFSKHPRRKNSNKNWKRPNSFRPKFYDGKSCWMPWRPNRGGLITLPPFVGVSFPHLLCIPSIPSRLDSKSNHPSKTTKTRMTTKQRHQNPKMIPDFLTICTKASGVTFSKKVRLPPCTWECTNPSRPVSCTGNWPPRGPDSWACHRRVPRRPSWGVAREAVRRICCPSISCRVPPVN